ncbi:MAG TPA: glycosyltransferase [Verrucomicrobiae bacterium]
MKILHVIRSINPAHGGPVEAVRNLGAANVRAGHLVEVATLDGADAPFVTDFPLRLRCFGPSLLKFSYTPRLVPWLRKHRQDYDAVVVNGLWQFNSYGVYKALCSADTPYFIYPHGMLDPWFKGAYPLKHLKKIIYWKLIQHRVVANARAVLFTCEQERILARETFRPYRCREMVVNYGTSAPTLSVEQREQFLQKFPETKGKRCLLFMGRIHEKKGCDLLIRAFHNVLGRDESRNSFHLIMAGPDERGLAGNLKSLAQSLGIADRITWTGMLSGDLKWGAFQVADAFILPSHQENFGIAVVEALACGVPVLVSNQVNIWREIRDAGAGLVENDDQAGTDNLMRRWINLSQSEIQKMRDATIPTFNARFEIQQAARSMVEAISATMSDATKHTVCA